MSATTPIESAALAALDRAAAGLPAEARAAFLAALRAELETAGITDAERALHQARTLAGDRLQDSWRAGQEADAALFAEQLRAADLDGTLNGILHALRLGESAGAVGRAARLWDELTELRAGRENAQAEIERARAEADPHRAKLLILLAAWARRGKAAITDDESKLIADMRGELAKALALTNDESTRVEWLAFEPQARPLAI